MDTAKARLWNGHIVAQIPFEKKDRVINARNLMGYKFVKPRDKAPYWEFPYSPIVASVLHRELGDQIDYIDAEIPDLHRSYQDALQAKVATNLPPVIPGLKNINPKNGQPLKPWQHQVQGFHFCRDLPGCMLAYSMGTGKSLVAVALVVNSKHDRVLIVCPKSVMPVWPKELQYAQSSSKFLVYTATGRETVKVKAKRLKTLADSAERHGQPFVAIINYDSFWREDMSKVLLSYDWDILIADEIHRAKNPGSSAKASKFLTKIAERSSKRIGLTGTPLPHSPMDIFAQYRALDSSMFGTSFHRFKTRYAIMGGFNNKEIVAYQNQDELTEKIHSIAIFAKKDEVLDLPPFMHDYRTFQLSTKAQKLYDELDRQLFAEIESGKITVANAMVKVLRLQQLTSGYLALDNQEQVTEVDNSKKQALKDLLEDIPQEEPIVVFCRFRPDLDNIKAVCAELGRTSGELSGRMSNLKEWQDGELNTLAVQIRSGGVGIDLTRTAYCVYYSVGHSLGDYLQSLDRSHRHGQTRAVTYYHLLAEGTIDEKVYKALQKRKNIIDAIMALEEKYEKT